MLNYSIFIARSKVRALLVIGRKETRQLIFIKIHTAAVFIHFLVVFKVHAIIAFHIIRHNLHLISYDTTLIISKSVFTFKLKRSTFTQVKSAPFYYLKEFKIHVGSTFAKEFCKQFDTIINVIQRTRLIRTMHITKRNRN